MTEQRNLPLEIVDALATTEHSAPQELAYSLHEYVDTDALRALATMEQTDWKLTFQVPDHQVTVTGEGRIHVDGTLVRVADMPDRQTLQ